MSFIINLLLLVLPLVASAKDPGMAGSVANMHVLKIAAKDGSVVVGLADGKPRVIKVGDVLGSNAKVTEISDGRVVIEEARENEIEMIIIRLNDGEQTMQRIKRVSQPGVVLLAPSARDKRPTSKGK
jgi:hypothetical protein